MLAAVALDPARSPPTPAPASSRIVGDPFLETGGRLLAGADERTVRTTSSTPTGAGSVLRDGPEVTLLVYVLDHAGACRAGTPVDVMAGGGKSNSTRPSTPRSPGCTSPARPGTPRGNRRARTRPSVPPVRIDPGTSSAMSAIWVSGEVHLEPDRRIELERPVRPRQRRGGSCADPAARSAGERLRAANRPTACFTTTVSTASPSSSRASAASA